MLKPLPLFLLLLTSCALFKTRPALESMDLEKLLSSVRLVGEGRGRLTLGGRQYVFGVDSVLRENHDWVMAVAIPLHGEEVMILPDLRAAVAEGEETESFEARIAEEFRNLGLDRSLSSAEFMRELRGLVRFTAAPLWGSLRGCGPQKVVSECQLDGQKYGIEARNQEFFIHRSIRPGVGLELVAKNLTESFFHQIDIRLYINRTQQETRPPEFSLELFW